MACIDFMNNNDVTINDEGFEAVIVDFINNYDLTMNYVNSF